MKEVVTESCAPCRGTGSIAVSDTPGGPTRDISCSTCWGQGFHYKVV